MDWYEYLWYRYSYCVWFQYAVPCSCKLCRNAQ